MITPAGYAQAEQVRREAGRRLIVRLIFIVFLLLIFEGALRKWVLPDFQRALYFSRDPFVLLIYASVLLNGLILRSRMLIALGLFALSVSGFHLLLAIFGIGHPIAWALGVRHYFFYIPLAFIIGRCFRFEDLAALTHLNLLLAIPIAVLVYLQYLSPPSAFVNRALADDLDNVTHLAGDVLRPYGTFTFSSGHVFYVAATVAMMAAAWLTRREMRLPWRLLLPASAATLVMALTTGSRTIWFLLASTGLCLGATAFSGARFGHSLRALGFILLVALGIVVLYASLLNRAYESMLVRQETATRQEGPTIGRALRMATHAFEILGEAPITGNGLGSGILGAVAAITGERHFSLAETEWDRIVLELGPVLGLLFIGLRLVLVTWLLWRALTANRTFGNPVGLVLFGFVGPNLLLGQITMSGQGAIFAWLFIGLILVATEPQAQPMSGPARLATNPQRAETRAGRAISKSA